MPERLVIFLKAPRAGEVKTRLARDIGPDAACSAYRQLTEIALHKVSSLSNVELRYAPDNAANEVEPWSRNGWRLHPQGGGDLGARMLRAFCESFMSGAQRVVIIGTDCPWVTVTDIQNAWQALRTHDVVLGPALDGGYWLIGLSRPAPELFDRMEWSTNAVLQQTIARAEAAGLRIQLLRELRDVDTLEDWQYFERRMK